MQSYVVFKILGGLILKIGWDFGKVKNTYMIS